MAINKIKPDKDILGNDILLMQGELGEVLVVPLAAGAMDDIERHFAMLKAAESVPRRTVTDNPQA